MITYVEGNLFTSPAQVLVNTVNTIGIMGKGIAHDFKRIYPDMYRIYRRYCDNKHLTVGTLHLHKTPHKWVMNFPTKQHWRSRSRLDHIARGLRTFCDTYSEAGITSIAFPALGCGNGELDYDGQVRPLLEEYLSPLPISVFLYPPRPRASTATDTDIAHIDRWLQSRPATLPFDEVWRELSTIVTLNTEFTTIPKGHVYNADITTDGAGGTALRITAADRTYRYDSEMLLDFWQQLRDHGFAYRSISGHYHRISYLIPIFSKLPYVDVVKVSEVMQGFRSPPAVALQVIPPPAPDDGAFASNRYAVAEV